MGECVRQTGDALDNPLVATKRWREGVGSRARAGSQNLNP
jgi:hypothetical protein